MGGRVASERAAKYHPRRRTADSALLGLPARSMLTGYRWFPSAAGFVGAPTTIRGELSG